MVQEKLKTARKLKGISQEKMAKIISTDASNYSRKERGEVKIHEEEWEKFANALDLPIEEIKENMGKSIFNFDNSTFHDHSGSNINYHNVSNTIIENLNNYIALLKEQTELLRMENQNLKKN